MSAPRKLAAILAADVAGYSRLTGIDEEGTLKRMRKLRRELINPAASLHRGRIVKTTGDGILIEFPSVVDAVRCALDVQREMDSRNSDSPVEQRIEFRVGINLGDVVIEGEDLLGDGVNVAARLEGISEPGGICISDAAYHQVRDKLDVNFEDAGEQQLKNIARPVRIYRLRSDRSFAQSRPTLPLPDKPSIAVLPFTNMSGDPEQEYFADGMVEEIVTALSRIRWLFVIARNSSFIYKGRLVDVKQVGRELGVRYLLEGSVRKAGSRVRITGQLIDATSAAHLWADNFDGSLEDIFDLQNQVAISVAGVIEPTLQAAEMRRSAERPTNDPTAYDLYLQALSHFVTWERKGNLAALDLVERAIERDPNHGPALALMARCHLNLHANGWSEDPQRSRALGLEAARRALLVSGDRPEVLGRAAYTLAYFGEDIEASIALVDRALFLNPSFAQGWHESGWLRLWIGRLDVAATHLEKSLRLSPVAGTAGGNMGLGVVHFFAHRFEEATRMLLLAMQERPNWAPTHRFLAACYVQMGRLADARATVERLRAITPLLIPSATHWRNADQREFYLSSLRLAVSDPLE